MTGRLFNKIYVVIIAFSLTVSGCSAKNHILAKNNNNNLLTLIFLDVAQGESTLLMLPDGINILVDTGSPATGPMLADDIRSLGIDRIDHLIFTHPHEDHIGGIFNVLHEMEVSNFYDNSFNNFKSNIFDDYVRLVREDKSGYHILQSGNILDFGDVKIDVLNPIIPPSGDINEDSIVMRVSYGEINILLTGDVRNIGEERILKSEAELKSNILKVGHHGDRNASTSSFLEKVAPEVAIVSVGAGNKYSKPHEDAMLRIHDTGAKVLRTDLHGTITVETDGTTYSITTEINFNH
jgi:beta-lactamase superfamily II metal-dependent hydrolase